MEIKRDYYLEQLKIRKDNGMIIKNIRWYVMVFIVGCIIGLTATVLGGCGANTVPTDETTLTEITETYEQPAETLPETEALPETETTVVIDETADVVTDEAVDEVTEPNTEPVYSNAEVQDATVTTWITSNQAYPDLTVNSGLQLDDGRLAWNFANGVAVGKTIDEETVTTTEADYGFTVKVIDDNRVCVTPYNNTDTDVTAVSISVAMDNGDLICDETSSEYVISGYAGGANGLGLIKVTFSDGYILTAGVWKENDRLYAVNITGDINRATRTVNVRLNLAELMAGVNITEKDALYTEPIYYPIVPIAEGETTDTQYWLDKSFELVEPEWTDAHKVMAFYNYVIDNMVYDEWVAANNTYGRFYVYEDYSGKYYISQTNIGICEDFSQIISIMCRAQGIPAFVLGNSKHAVSAAYIEDYERWIIVDSTPSVGKMIYNEEGPVVDEGARPRYYSIDYTSSKDFNDLYIGNSADMKLQGIPTYY